VPNAVRALTPAQMKRFYFHPFNFKMSATFGTRSTPNTNPKVPPIMAPTDPCTVVSFKLTGLL